MHSLRRVFPFLLCSWSEKKPSWDFYAGALSTVWNSTLTPTPLLPCDPMSHTGIPQGTGKISFEQSPLHLHPRGISAAQTLPCSCSPPVLGALHLPGPSLSPQVSLSHGNSNQLLWAAGGGFCVCCTERAVRAHCGQARDSISPQCSL